MSTSFKPYPSNKEELEKAYSLHKPLRLKTMHPLKASKITNFHPDHILAFYMALNSIQEKQPKRYESL